MKHLPEFHWFTSKEFPTLIYIYLFPQDEKAYLMDNTSKRASPGSHVQGSWLPDGYSWIFRSYVFGSSGFWTMPPLHYAAKFDPFLSSDCALTPSTPAQIQGREAIKFCHLATLCSGVLCKCQVPAGAHLHEGPGDAVLPGPGRLLHGLQLGPAHPHVLGGALPDQGSPHVDFTGIQISPLTVTLFTVMPRLH